MLFSLHLLCTVPIQNTAFLCEGNRHECQLCLENFGARDLLFLEPCCPTVAVCKPCLSATAVENIRAGLAPSCPNCSRRLSSLLTAEAMLDIGCQLQGTGCEQPAAEGPAMFITTGCPLQHKFCRHCLAHDVRDRLQRGLPAECPRASECGHTMMSAFLHEHVFHTGTDEQEEALMLRNDE